MDVQRDHFDRLRRCLDDRLAAFEILCGNSKMEEADELARLDEEDPIPANVLTQLKRYRKPVVEMPQNDNDENERKNINNSAFYIPIPKSRNIYGVADISRKLRKGECFVQGSGFEHAFKKTESRVSHFRFFDPSWASINRLISITFPLSSRWD